jgi:hypothetical protein
VLCDGTAREWVIAELVGRGCKHNEIRQAGVRRSLLHMELFKLRRPIANSSIHAMDRREEWVGSRIQRSQQKNHASCAGLSVMLRPMSMSLNDPTLDDPRRRCQLIRVNLACGSTEAKPLVTSADLLVPAGRLAFTALLLAGRHRGGRARLTCQTHAASVPVLIAIRAIPS